MMAGEISSRNRRQFASWARFYDRSIFQFYFKKIQNAVLEILRGFPQRESFLDIGCGTGNLLLNISAEFPNAQLTGIDPSPEMLAIAKNKVHRADFYEGVGGKLPFNAGSFDIVTITESLHHHSDPIKSIAEAARVTKNGGLLIIADPDSSGLFGLVFYGFLGRLIEGDVRFLTVDEVIKILQDSGFQIQGQRRVFKNYLVWARKN